MPRHDVLWQRLESARRPELERLGAVVGLADVAGKSDPVLVEELSREIRAAAGHSLLNPLRHPHEFPYKQMLIDVADKIAPGWTPLAWTKYTLHDRHADQEVEETIWSEFERRMNAEIARMSPEKREELRKKTEEELKNLGHSEALVALVGNAIVTGVIAGGVAPALAYSIAINTASGLALLQLWWAGSASIAAILGTGGGVFALLYAPVLAWWLGSTAYRKTVPATLHLIQIRKLREIEKTLG